MVVAGNIGSGKTTLTKKLSERLGWKPYFDPKEFWKSKEDHKLESYSIKRSRLRILGKSASLLR